jgi:hypothetical protein
MKVNIRKTAAKVATVLKDQPELINNRQDREPNLTSSTQEV